MPLAVCTSQDTVLLFFSDTTLLREQQFFKEVNRTKTSPYVIHLGMSHSRATVFY
jgi:hypothetical protein